MPRADAIKRKSLRFVPLPRDGGLVTGEYSVAIIRIARAPLLSRVRSVATGPPPDSIGYMRAAPRDPTPQCAERDRKQPFSKG